MGLEDRCIDCHMPRSPNEQVPHAATTLHLIPRFKDRIGAARDPQRPSDGREGPLIHFHRDQLDPREHIEVTRDLGIALAMNQRTIPGITAAAASRMALPILETSREADTGDAPAWAARGTALWTLGRREESLTAFRTALAKSPDCEEILVASGTRAAQSGRREEALDDFGRAIAINPWRSDYHEVVALLRYERQESTAAVEAARNSVRLNPSNHEARVILIQCLLKDQRLPEARNEFRILLDHDPPRREALEAWFARSSGR
jgi:tetratricopeptide (TPR) repeat protein